MNPAPHVLVIFAAGWAALSPIAAVAGESASPSGVLDSVLQTLDLKAKPADPAPDFVRKTRPDVSGLDFMQGPLAHKVSPIPTKTPAQVEAAKGALDAARERQLAPAPPPVLIVPPGAAKPDSAKSDAAKLRAAKRRAGSSAKPVD